MCYLDICIVVIKVEPLLYEATLTLFVLTSLFL